MFDLLKNYNIPVYITRDNDVTLSPSVRTNKIKNYFGTSSDVILISNHVNAGGAEISKCDYI